jgi:cyclopropane fatty-acyl-phospholipid synthase-like methyltransferase
MEEIYERIVPGTLSWEMYGYDHYQRYQFFLDEIKNKTVLDVACGSGYGSFEMAGMAKSVTGIDIAEEAISFAKKQYQKNNLEFKILPCERIDELSHQYDVVISFETIEHLSNPTSFLEKIHHILTPHGLLIISFPNKHRHSALEWGQKNPFHLSELYFEEYLQLIENWFTIEEKYHQSESINYMRYLELKHLLHNIESKMMSSWAFRIEKLLRKIFNKPYQLPEFFHTKLEYYYEGDFMIEKLQQPEKWHKTFILKCKKKI